MTSTDGFDSILEEHREHQWREIPPCVYCVDCDIRLYQGSLPEWKDPELAARRATCPHDDHVMYVDEETGYEREMGEGFYWVCADCGHKGWYE